jgi:hypothetical protein
VVFGSVKKSFRRCRGFVTWGNKNAWGINFIVKRRNPVRPVSSVCQSVVYRV